MYVPTTIKIVALKGNHNNQGKIPLYLRFTQNRQTHRISLRKRINPSSWIDNGKAYVRERGALAAENGRAINLFLKSQVVRAEGIMLEAERKNQTLTFRQFKDQFINIQSQDFFAFCRHEITKRENSGKYSMQTIKSNRLRLKKVKSYRSNVCFLDLNLQFLEDYEVYLRVKRKNSINTIFAAMKFIRTMLNAAKKKR